MLRRVSAQAHVLRPGKGAHVPTQRITLPPSGTRLFSFSAPRGAPRLVILGSGWGGYEVLRGIDKKRWSEGSARRAVQTRSDSDIFTHFQDVTVVSPTQYFNFTPLLASCAVGTLEFRSAVEPVSAPTRSIIRVLTQILLGEAIHTASRESMSLRLT